MQDYGVVDHGRQRSDAQVSALTSPECPTRLFTIQEAAEALRIPISWLYERTRRNAIRAEESANTFDSHNKI
jgi:hypothetical protein